MALPKELHLTLILLLLHIFEMYLWRLWKDTFECMNPRFPLSGAREFPEYISSDRKLSREFQIQRNHTNIPPISYPKLHLSFKRTCYKDMYKIWLNLHCLHSTSWSMRVYFRGIALWSIELCTPLTQANLDPNFPVLRKFL